MKAATLLGNDQQQDQRSRAPKGLGGSYENFGFLEELRRHLLLNVKGGILIFLYRKDVIRTENIPDGPKGLQVHRFWSLHVVVSIRGCLGNQFPGSTSAILQPVECFSAKGFEPLRMRWLPQVLSGTQGKSGCQFGWQSSCTRVCAACCEKGARPGERYTRQSARGPPTVMIKKRA